MTHRQRRRRGLRERRRLMLLIHNGKPIRTRSEFMAVFGKPSYSCGLTC